MADSRPRRPPPDQSAHTGARTRAAAAQVVSAVCDGGQSLTDALDGYTRFADERDRPLVQELSYGTLRTLPRLTAVAAQMLQRPFDPEERDLNALILVGLYQLINTRIPPHAVVAATVDAARVLGKPWAVPVVNAVLRRFQREGEGILAQADRDPRVQWLFPSWLLGRLRAAWPEHWQEIADASNARPPMTLRVNAMKTDRAAYAGLLTAAGMTARPVPHAKQALILDAPVPVKRLPGFEEGLVSVQDAGAQLAAVLLDAKPKQRVLDACAAPGGKTAHILEHAGNDLDLTAVEVDPGRLAQLAEGLVRLGLSARAVQGNAADPAGEWAEQRYDCILMDVPCSGTGVIRRHPDIKWLRRTGDIDANAALQTRMLDALWPLLAPGGRLLYVTCSLLPEENEHQVGGFLARTADAREEVLEVPWGLRRVVGRQILPSSGMDGFYYARLRKAQV